LLSAAVQEEAIPEGLAGNDIVAQAKSGMGKTAVFVVVTLERITAEDGLQCICIVHTRELAYQVAKEFERFKAYLEGITVHSVYGGVALPAQEKMLKDDPPHVIVACPGRLKVLIQRKTVDVGAVKIFVIDEVDKVLEKADMRQDVQEIFYKTPKAKQTMVFSATLPPEIRGTVMKFVKNVSLPRRTVHNDGRGQEVPCAGHGLRSTQWFRSHRHRASSSLRSCRWIREHSTSLVHGMCS
jgi:ATP-dependent RNA helicase UAP56/SUB2